MTYPSLLPLLITVLALGVLPSGADIQITLRNISNDTATYDSYQKVEFFKSKFANTNGSMRGYLHQPEGSEDGCRYIPPIPDVYPRADDNSTVIWIAVLEGYPRCVEDMLMYVANAGYGLILASSPNNSDTNLGAIVRNSGFPVVIIDKEYYDTLVATALSDLQNPEVLATVTTGMQVFIATVVVISGFICIPMCFLCCIYCVWCLSRRRRRRFEAEIRGLEQRRRNFSRLQNRDRLARQELMESILRQLQQLQLDSQTQQPLGASSTKQLPTMQYKKLEMSSPESESCAICVDDFKEGDMMRVLPCNHHFHLDCIDEWLINHSDLCPLCKNQVPRQGSDGVQFQGSRGRGGNRGRRGARVQVGVHDSVAFTDEEEEDDDSESSEISLQASGARNRLLGTASARESRYGSV